MISVVIPCYNVEATLADQVDRLLPQVIERDAELVLVDNNSNDETPRLLERLSRSEHVVVNAATERQGAAYARNVGVEIASGDLLLFCDADDLVDEGWVATMADALKDSAVVTGQLETASLNTEVQRGGRSHSTDLSTFYGLFPLVHGGNMATTREAWKAIGPLDESMRSGEDIEWSLRAYVAGFDIAKLQDAVIHYRYRSSARDLWKQGLSYGTFRPEIARRAHALLGDRVSRLAGVKSWAWLLLHAPSILSAERRAQLAWVAGNRLGHVRGSFRSRFMLL